MGFLSRQPTPNEPEHEDVFFHKLCGEVKCAACGRWFKPNRSRSQVSHQCFKCSGIPEAPEDPPNVGCASGESGEAD